MSGEAPAAKSKGKLGSRIGIGAAIAIAGWLLYSSMGGARLSDGTAAPPFRLPSAQEAGFVALEDFKGKVVVLDFWSTHCPPCIKEMENLKKISARMMSKDVVVLGIAVGGEDVEEIRQFAHRFGVEYPLGVDERGSVSLDYRVAVLPTVYILDKNGVIVDSHSGYWGEGGLMKSVEAALKR